MLSSFIWSINACIGKYKEIENLYKRNKTIRQFFFTGTGSTGVIGISSIYQTVTEKFTGFFRNKAFLLCFMFLDSYSRITQ